MAAPQHRNIGHLASIVDPAPRALWHWQGKPRFIECTAPSGLQGAPSEPTGSSEPAAASNARPSEVQTFQLGRRGMTPHAAKHIQNVMQAGDQGMRPGESPPLPRPLFSFLNHHILPILAHVAVAQHHAMLQLSERMRNWRPRNPFHRRQRVDAHPTGESSMYTFRGPKATKEGKRLYEHARALEKALDPVAAAHAFMAAVKADTRQAEWLSLAAKQWSDATYTDNVNTATAQQYNRTAIETATRAMELAPNAAHSYIARCVSRGRLALLCDNKTKVHLAREACDDAARALELEPRNDYAHHLMGRWHFEMAGLSAIARTLVRLLYGTALMSGSYSMAAEHYRTATQLAPRVLVHRAELGRSLIKLGHKQEGISELQAALTCDVDDLNSHLTKIEVAKQLDGLLGNAKSRAFYLLPAAVDLLPTTQSTDSRSPSTPA